VGMIKLLDTNIVLYYLGGKLSENLPKSEYYVSVITEIELLSYPNLNKKAETQIRDFLSELTIVELNSEIKLN
jgi:predicted nucleic acid-binding protein